MKTYTRGQLALRNGQDKPEIWVAFRGLIYDMTNSKHWAGQDLTPEIADAPHSEKVFEKFTPIGILE
jgi:predicted heme/steroid binding protein